jgi:hypothetical protein
MNAVEIEEAISALAEAPLDARTFPYGFLQASGLNDAKIRRLKSGETPTSPISRAAPFSATRTTSICSPARPAAPPPNDHRRFFRWHESWRR